MSERDMQVADGKRKPGRPRVHEPKPGLSLSTWVEPNDYDHLLKLANEQDQKLSAYLRDIIKKTLRR